MLSQMPTATKLDNVWQPVFIVPFPNANGGQANTRPLGQALSREVGQTGRLKLSQDPADGFSQNAVRYGTIIFYIFFNTINVMLVCAKRIQLW